MQCVLKIFDLHRVMMYDVHQREKITVFDGSVQIIPKVPKQIDVSIFESVGFKPHLDLKSN